MLNEKDNKVIEALIEGLEDVSGDMRMQSETGVRAEPMDDEALEAVSGGMRMRDR